LQGTEYKSKVTFCQRRSKLAIACFKLAFYHSRDEKTPKKADEAQLNCQKTRICKENAKNWKILEKTLAKFTPACIIDNVNKSTFLLIKFWFR
jgi:hypothetical protein